MFLKMGKDYNTEDYLGEPRNSLLKTKQCLLKQHIPFTVGSPHEKLRHGCVMQMKWMRDTQQLGSVHPELSLDQCGFSPNKQYNVFSCITKRPFFFYNRREWTDEYKRKKKQLCEACTASYGIMKIMQIRSGLQTINTGREKSCKLQKKVLDTR